jgi:hypothetical protein
VNGPPAGGADRLDHQGRVFINFKNSTFQWVDIQRFLLPATVTDQQVLAMLIEHDMYGYDYAGGDPGSDPARHGPYWRDQVTPGAFEPTDAIVEQDLLQEWAERYAELPEHLRADVEREVYTPLRTADSIYRLRDLGAAAFHDWGGIHNDFHELLLIDRSNSTCTLMVAADD